jgi:hypothetical protein
MWWCQHLTWRGAGRSCRHTARTSPWARTWTCRCVCCSHHHAPACCQLHHLLKLLPASTDACSSAIAAVLTCAHCGSTAHAAPPPPCRSSRVVPPASAALTWPTSSTWQRCGRPRSTTLQSRCRWEACPIEPATVCLAGLLAYICFGCARHPPCLLATAVNPWPCTFTWHLC